MLRNERIFKFTWMKAKKVLKKKKKRKPLPTSRFISDNSRLSIGIVFVSLQNLGRLENSKSPRYLPGIFPKGFPLGFFRRVFPWNFPPGFSSGIVLKGASLKFFRRWKLVKLHSWHKGSIHFFQVTLDSSDMFLLECVLEFSQFFPISILNIVKGIYIFHIQVAGWTNLWKSLWFWSVTILAIRISLYFFPINCQKVPFPW